MSRSTPLFQFPTAAAAESFVAELEARGAEFDGYALAPDPKGAGVILAIHDLKTDEP